ncbi:hypothetical protein BgiMline_018433, partial [Biomphalaria glabrata]
IAPKFDDSQSADSLQQRYIPFESHRWRTIYVTLTFNYLLDEGPMDLIRLSSLAQDSERRHLND